MHSFPRSPGWFACAWLGLALLSLGCGGPGENVSFTETVELERAEQAIQVDMLCDCFAALPGSYPDEATCIEALTIPADASVEACRVSAYDLAPASSRAHLECRLGVMRDATACLAETYTCEDTSTFLLCDEMRAAALDACPPLATIVIDAQIECADTQ